MMYAYVILAISALMLRSARANPPSPEEWMPMNTQISLGDARPVSSNIQSSVVIDPAALVNDISQSHKALDIEEDPNDKFITSRSGKLRRQFHVDVDGQDWIEDTLGPRKVLSRVKRCGGGGGDDDDGGASRARRTRRNRGRRARRNRVATTRESRKAKRKASRKVKKTVVTRKIIQNGQVISETTKTENQPTATNLQQPATVIKETIPAQQSIVTQTVPAGQPQVVYVQPQVEVPAQAHAQAITTQ